MPATSRTRRDDGTGRDQLARRDRVRPPAQGEREPAFADAAAVFASGFDASGLEMVRRGATRSPDLAAG